MNGMQKLSKFTFVKKGLLNLITLFFLSFNTGYTQGYQYGVELSPSFDFQLQTASNNTWSTIRGNGFLLGLFFDKKLNEHSLIGTAAKFEYIAFNQKAGDFVVNSFRIASINVPITFKQEIGLTKNWFYSVGAGFNYNFLNRQLLSGIWFNLNENANQWQPYGSIGLNYLMDSRFEIGIHARYHFLDLWSESFQAVTQTKTKLISFDFSLRYTIASH